MTAQYRELARSFEAREVDPVAFRHREHVAVAYEMLRKHDFIEAAVKYGDNIQAIASKAGVPRKFNTTITFAFMSLIAERMATNEQTDFDSFIATNEDLLSKQLLLTWYSPERLQSELARGLFLMPDKAPLP